MKFFLGFGNWRQRPDKSKKKINFDLDLENIFCIFHFYSNAKANALCLRGVSSAAFAAVLYLLLLCCDVVLCTSTSKTVRYLRKLCIVNSFTMIEIWP